MILKSCKILFKVSLIVTLSSTLILCKSVKKRATYRQYQQPYYHQQQQQQQQQQSAIINQEYVPQQQYQPISENQYHQEQLEHINQHLQHQFVRPQTQHFYNHDRVQHYQQRNHNKDQFNHALNGQLFMNQHRVQHPQFDEHVPNTGEQNYKQNRRHINEDQQEVIPTVTESHTNEPVNENNVSTTPMIEDTDLTQKTDEVLKKELDNENEISGENLKEPNKREHDTEDIKANEEDCESKEYIAAKHEIDDKKPNEEEDCESKEYIAAKHETEDKKPNEEEDCESKEYIAAKHEIEDKKPNEEEDCESKEYIAAKHETEDHKENNEEDCESKEYIAAKHETEDNKLNEEDCESKEYIAAKHEEQKNEEDCESKEYLAAKHAEEAGKEIITQPKDLIESSTDETVSTTGEVHQDLDPHLNHDSDDVTRNERTIIGRLHSIDDPRLLLDNFRHKLKTARSNIEQAELMNRRRVEPKVFIYDPNLPVLPSPSAFPTRYHQPAYQPLHQNIDEYQLPQNKYRQSLLDGLKDKQNDGSFSESSEERKTEDNKTTGKQDENIAGGNMEQNDQQMRSQPGRNPHPDEIRQLLHVRDEVNRIRHIMQVLKENELKQKYGPKFQNTRNLTETEEKEMKDFVEKLKKDGKISTSAIKPQNNQDGIQSNPGDVPDTKQLIEEIGKLKQSMKHFAKNVGVNKDDSTEANLEKLEEQIIAQKQEIQNLRKLVEDLLPPTDFPSPTSSAIIKHPELEKHHLHHELQALQETLNELLNKEEKTLKTAQDVAGKFRARASENESGNPKDASDKEIGTLVKILHTVQHPAESKNAVLEKLEQMEHEIKKLDFQNHRTRQEMLLEKLEREVKNLKDIKKSKGDSDDLSEKIRNLEDEIEKLKRKPVNAKLDELEKQIQGLSKPMGRELNDNIEKELDRLQKQIDSMNTKGHTKPSSRQLEGLLSDILTGGEGSNEKQGNIPPHSILNGESNQQAPVFQLPYCLQKQANYAGYQDGPSPNYQAPSKHQQLSTNYNNVGPQSISYANYKYIPQPKPVVLQPVQFQPQKQIYSKQPQHNYQPPKPIVHQVYGPLRPPTYGPQKPYPSHKPDAPAYEAVKPINAEYPPSNANQYKVSPIAKETKPCGHSEEMEEQIRKLNAMLNVLNEKIDYGNDPEPEDYEGIYKRTQTTKTRAKRENEQIDIEQDKQQLIREIRKRLADLREEVQTVNEPHPYTNTSSDEQSGKRSASAYYQPGGYGSKLSLKKKQKFDDLFIKVVKFILHKLEISAPYVVESLFNGDTYTYEHEYDGGYNNNDGYRMSGKKMRSDDGDDDGDVFDFDEDTNNEIENKKPKIFGGLLNNFQGFSGLLGFIPNILLKLLSNFSSFLNILKRNKFFKNFLFPGALILVIDGIMALLIWWFSADDTQNLFDFNLSNVENNSLN